MRKAEFLKHWKGLVGGKPLKPRPVPYKHEGSTYCEDGIRITGSQEFIDSVLLRLKELLACENTQTRLQVNHQESTDRESGLKTGSFNCYIQVHQRGGEAQMVNAFASAIVGREVIASKGY